MPHPPLQIELALIKCCSKLRVTLLLKFVKKIIKFGGEKVGLKENLVRLQKERGETNYRLAKAIGVSQTAVKNWLDGVNRPYPRHAKAIAKHYGVKVEDLMGTMQQE